MQGILIVDKDEGYTSHDIVNLVRRATGIKKVGHTGTLDPMATGILPICIGKATKVASYIQGEDKIYRALIKFGETTDTLDREGAIIKSGGRIPSLEEIEGILPRFQGEINQIPPMYSAIKIKGRKLYELAREGKEVERKPRKVFIHSLNLLNFEEEVLDVRIRCSSGTYIRTLAADMGEALGTYAHLIYLRRERVGNFTEKDCITTKLLKGADPDTVKSYLLSTDRGLESLPKIKISEDRLKDIIVGKRIKLTKGKPGLYRVYVGKKFVGLGTVTDRDSGIILHVKKLLME